MVIPSAPVVPSHDDGGVGPILAVTDRVHDACHPMRPSAVIDVSVIGNAAVGNYPTYRGQLRVGNVRQNLIAALLNNHVVGPIGPRAGCAIRWRHIWNTHVLNGIGTGPDAAGRRSVVLPADLLAVKLISQGRVFVAGICRMFNSRRIDQRDGFIRRSDATGETVRAYKADRVLGCEPVTHRHSWRRRG